MLTCPSLSLHTAVRRRVAVLGLCLPLLALVGCANNTSGITFGEPLVDDSALSAKVRVALEESPLTANQGIMVSTRPNGIIRLSGIVDTDLVSGNAEQIAARVEGVNGVVNTLYAE